MPNAQTCLLCKMDITGDHSIQHIHNCKRIYGNTGRRTSVQKVLESGLDTMKDCFAKRHEPLMREFYIGTSADEKKMPRGYSGDILLTSLSSGERTLIDLTVIQLPYVETLATAVEVAEKKKYDTYCNNYNIEKDRVLPMVFFYNGLASSKSDEAIRSWCLTKSNVARDANSLRLRSNQDAYLQYLNSFRIRLSVRLAKHGATQYFRYLSLLPARN